MLAYRSVFSSTTRISGAIRSLRICCRPSSPFRPLLVSPSSAHFAPLQLVRGFSTERNVERRNKTGILGSIAVGATVLFGKAKYVLVALKLTKLTPLVSMILSSAAYSLFFGWPYAVGMVGLIFVHECGHAVAMRHYNIPFSPMVFVPFMGAVIAMKEMPRDAYTTAMIALAGPLVGSVAALGVGSAGIAMNSQLLLALADFGYMINLFNLLPIGSLDGGRIGDAISPHFGLAGLAAGGGLIYMDAITNPIFYLIMLGGTYSTLARYFKWGDYASQHPHYYHIGRGKQASLFAAYMALIAGILAAMTLNNQYRKSPKQLKNPYHYDNLPRHRDGVYDDYFSDISDGSDDDW